MSGKYSNRQHEIKLNTFQKFVWEMVELIYMHTYKRLPQAHPDSHFKANV